MKNCKSCQKEIDEKATKCPYCQAFQNWLKSPQLIGVIFPLMFLLYVIVSIRDLHAKKSYADFTNDFSSTLISEASDNKNDIHTYEIQNLSKHKWSNISYQMKGYDQANQIVIVESENEYDWVVQPNSKSMLSIKTDKNEKIVKWDFQITDMRVERF
jgi:hypothetical protein